MKYCLSKFTPTKQELHRKNICGENKELVNPSVYGVMTARGNKVSRANTSFVRVLSKLAKGQYFVKTQIYLFI